MFRWRGGKNNTELGLNSMKLFLQQLFAEAAVPSPAADVRWMGSCPGSRTDCDSRPSQLC